MVTTRTFGMRFAKALGLSTDRLMSIHIDIEPGEVVSVKCVYSAGIVDGEIEEVLREYTIVERDPR